MGKQKQKRKTRKREQVIEAAESLFSRFGTKKVTVEEICRKADVSKMTFYKYFSNKAGLVKVIRDKWTEEGFSKFDEISNLDIPFPEKINLMTKWKVEFFSRINTDFIRELISVDEVVEYAKGRYLKNITDAQERGEIRSDIKPEFLWIVTEKLYELIKEQSWEEVFSDYRQFQVQLRTLIFYGLLSR
jgi:AcrR family transcriptional regulator